MNIRTIRKLVVRPTVRQVDAHEACAGRYLGFTLVLGAALAGIYTGNWIAQTKLPMAIFAVLLSLLFFRPWHRQLRVDMDALTLSFAWRVLAVLPIYRRTFDLDGKLLAIQTVGVTKSASATEQQVSSGCLMLALPFPISALFWLLGSGEKEDNTKTVIFKELCLRNPEGDRVFAAITQLATYAAGAEFLEAVREILPENVRPLPVSADRSEPV